jgi:hypothetical protein
VARRRIDGTVAEDGQHVLVSAGKIHDGDLWIFFGSPDGDEGFFAAGQMRRTQVPQLTSLGVEPGDRLRIASSARNSVETRERPEQNVAIRSPAPANLDTELAEASYGLRPTAVNRDLLELSVGEYPYPLTVR